MSETKIGFGASVDKLNSHMWSFGICLSHNYQETYVFINLFRWCISIGIIAKEAAQE